MSDKRWGDPEAWKCLSDEQRDIIREWWSEFEERRWERDEKERKKKENYLSIASAFALMPFAVWQAALSTGGDGSIWRFLLNAVCAWIVYAFVHAIAMHFYEHYYDSDKSNAWRVACVTVGVVFATLTVYGWIYG